MKEYVLRNARVVTPTTVMHGHVLVRDGLVADVDEGDIQPTTALECIDCEGDYLLPGFVELHTDNLEKHLVPVPKLSGRRRNPPFSPMMPRSWRPVSPPCSMPCPWANTTTRGASPCWAAVWMP